MPFVNHNLSIEEPEQITISKIYEYIAIIENCTTIEAARFVDKYQLLEETAFKYNRKSDYINTIEFKRALKIAITRANNAGFYPETPPSLLPYDGYENIELPNIAATLNNPPENKTLSAVINQTEEILSKRAETTYLNIIAALLETFQDEQRTFESQNKLIEHLASHDDGYNGLGESTLKAKFAAARKSLDQSK